MRQITEVCLRRTTERPDLEKLLITLDVELSMLFLQVSGGLFVKTIRFIIIQTTGWMFCLNYFIDQLNQVEFVFPRKVSVCRTCFKLKYINLNEFKHPAQDVLRNRGSDMILLQTEVDPILYHALDHHHLVFQNLWWRGVKKMADGCASFRQAPFRST